MTDYINVYQHIAEPLTRDASFHHHRADAEQDVADTDRQWRYLYTVEVDGDRATWRNLSEAAEEIRLEQAAGGYLSEGEHDRAYGGRR